MRYSDNLANIAAALCKVQGKIKNPIKNQVNKGVQGAPKYANLEDTLQDYVRPILSEFGMSVFQPIKTDEAGRVGVCTVLFHESGEFIEGDYVFCDVTIPTNSSGREILTQGQATGVNITYLRRYSLNAALGINGDKDTDGSYDDTQPAPAPAPKPATPAPAPKPMLCSDCQREITPCEIGGKRYSANAIAKNAEKKYGRILCADCSQKQAAQKDNEGEQEQC